MKLEPPVTRSYRSPLRTAQAVQTRRAIIEAATRLFVTAGYGATSIDEIAELAGVSRATVFAGVGGKAALLKRVYDVALVGDDEPVSLPDRAASRAIRAEPDPGRYLERYAGVVAELGGRVSAVYEAVRGAASTDPGVRPRLGQDPGGAPARRRTRSSPTRPRKDRCATGSTRRSRPISSGC